MIWKMVTKNLVRTFDGLDQQTQHAYINKTMALAFMAYTFKDRIDNEGDGIKLGLIKAQLNNVVKRMVRRSERQPDGSFRATGKPLRQKDDLYLVGCDVTGSDEETPDDPKFSWKHLFETTIFPDIKKLVDPGGRNEGYKMIFQGDNAGPHNEKVYFDLVTSHCHEQGWYWKPQAPPMPHMNNWDMSFGSVSVPVHVTSPHEICTRTKWTMNA